MWLEVLGLLPRETPLYESGASLQRLCTDSMGVVIISRAVDDTLKVCFFRITAGKLENLPALRALPFAFEVYGASRSIELYSTFLLNCTVFLKSLSLCKLV